MYKIIGLYQGNREEVDSFDSLPEAKKMLIEYQLAFGKEWYLYIQF